MTTNEIVVFVGIPASGKTSFYKERFFPSHVYISLDQLRSRSAEDEMLEFCINRQKRCVIDDTNVTRLARARYLVRAKKANVRIVCYCFVTSKADAIRRNAVRTGRACVRNAAIGAMYKQLEYPTLEEGYDELYFVRLGENGFAVEKYDEKRNQRPNEGI
ncbi:MAG: AAA family ATPase [Kiritimatiellae bacterium]|nr:AAA family ATPase [Kiritimatiellia bacterium]